MKFIPNGLGVIAIMKSPQMMNRINKEAQTRANRAGDGFIADGQLGKTRYRSIIYANTWSAKHREARENILLRVLHT